MRSGPTAAAAVLLSLALTLPACGGEETTAAGTEAAPGKGAPKGSAKAPTSGAKAGDQLAVRRCRRALGDFLDSMESLNNTLAVGLSYSDYLRTLNHVRASYAGVQADDLQLVCLTRAGSPAEHALNVYIEAANTWGECLASAACDPESIEAKLQREWGRASDLLSEAHAAVR